MKVEDYFLVLFFDSAKKSLMGYFSMVCMNALLIDVLYGVLSIITRYITHVKCFYEKLFNSFGGCIMVSFTDRLRELRKERGLTQKSLGELINAGERSIQGYELRESKPTLDVLVKLADCFDVSIDYLVGRSDNPKRF